jgi:hypothetical protein
MTRSSAKVEPDAADAPTCISLHVKNAKPAKVLKEISDQAHTIVAGWPDVFWTGQQPGVIPNVTLDLDHVTFWTAIQQVCAITHSHPQYIGQGQPGDVSLIMGNAGTWDQEGLFAFVPMTINHSSQVDLIDGSQTRDDSMMLSVFIDPRVHLAGWDSPRITVAEDEHGLSMLSRSVLPPGPNFDFLPQSGPYVGAPPRWSINTSLPLAFPAHRGDVLARLGGTMLFRLHDMGSLLQIDDLTNAVGKSTTVADQTATVTACTFDGNTTVTLHVRLSRKTGAGGSHGAEPVLHEFDSARIVDAAGQQLVPSGHGTGTDAQIDWEATFTGKKPAKPPFSLRLPITTPHAPMTVTFNFKDLPLPPH